MKQRSRLLPVLLTLALLLTFAPALTAPAQAAAATEVWIAGDEENYDATTQTFTGGATNLSTASHNALYGGEKIRAQLLNESGTGVKLLTLTGYRSDGSAGIAEGSITYGIKSDGDLTIVLMGDNQLHSSLNCATLYGIYVDGDLTIKNGRNANGGVNGTLDIAMSGAATSPAAGIYCTGKLIIRNNINGGGVTLTVNGSPVTGYSSAESYGIYAAGGVEVQSGTVTATGGTVRKSTSSSTDRSCGIYAGGMTLTGGTVAAAGGDAHGLVCKSCGVWVPSGKTLTVSSGALTATGALAEGSSVSGGTSCGVYCEGSTTLEGGTVDAAGGAAYGQYGYSAGIYAIDSLTISGSAKVDTCGGAAYNAVSCGIYACSGFETGSSCTVTAEGGKALLSRGIYVKGDVMTVRSGEISAMGGGCYQESTGIYVGKGLTVESGTVFAGGGAYLDKDNNDVASAAFGTSCGIELASSDDAAITFECGTVTAEGGMARNSYGIKSDKSLVCGGGEGDLDLTATGGAASWSCGVSAADMTCGVYCSLTATGGEATEVSHGVELTGALTCRDDSVLTATGGTALSESLGVKCAGLTCEGSAVLNAAGGEIYPLYYGSYGIWFDNTEPYALSMPDEDGRIVLRGHTGALCENCCSDESKLSALVFRAGESYDGTDAVTLPETEYTSEQLRESGFRFLALNPVQPSIDLWGTFVTDGVFTWKATLPTGGTVHLIAAWYDDGGRMLGVAVDTVVGTGKTETGTINVGSGARYKLMLVDGRTFAALCKTWDSKMFER